MVLVFALLTLGVMMTSDPTGATGMWDAFVDMAFRKGEMEPWLKWSIVAGYLVSMTLVEIFYVGGGFGLYLNCRTQLEGWDVEISFRTLARRLQKVATIVVFLGIASSALAIDVEKPLTKHSPEKESIQKVMAHTDFKIHSVRQRKVSDDSDWNMGGDTRWLAAIGKLLYYAIIAAVITWLVWLIYTNRHLFKRAGTRNTHQPAGPRSIMGLDIAPESLPDDILAAARARWAAGDARGALSLLYRGSLSWLVHNAKLPVREGDTEGDCVRHTRKLIEAGPRDYFAELTGQWVLVAYGERPPVTAEMERLLQTWPFTAKEAAK
jgi:hypothetical protein